jgi:hypothetical protein
MSPSFGTLLNGIPARMGFLWGTREFGQITGEKEKSRAGAENEKYYLI